MLKMTSFEDIVSSNEVFAMTPKSLLYQIYFVTAALKAVASESPTPAADKTALVETRPTR